ncbi:hypothetical protein [Primorskyibacter flagellatus]|uniref:Uncharacterized protein n=1 Tax=Primorskyibacter flagellatus TaxID=1387277 RepID=A0A1W2DQL9_9RHOB|nr:hypothetical protein [Primorskyibacter flagellatus]SMC99790.1 hypothetical protein SAMN06295998_1175 [Primorskyibacter flagellatus]
MSYAETRELTSDRHPAPLQTHLRFGSLARSNTKRLKRFWIWSSWIPSFAPFAPSSFTTFVSGAASDDDVSASGGYSRGDTELAALLNDKIEPCLAALTDE